MPYDLKNTVAINLQHLMEQSSDLKSQNALAKRSKVAQTTIGNYLRPDSYKGFPALDKLEMLAKALHVETWRLVHPTMGANCLSDRDFSAYQKARRAFENP